MNVLVTGGAGFIRGHLAEKFASEDYDAVTLDKFNPYYHISIKEHSVEPARDVTIKEANYELVEGDLRDEQLIDKLVQDAGYVYQQAAKAGYARTSGTRTSPTR